ncbi:MAG: hypothetical protein IPP71_11300 [Bacteroidetes bacterium]|nr:hypothetical protein [Bacteroidota bacterium]
MKTNNLVFGGILMISVATNIYLWLDRKNPTPPNLCNSTIGYDRPTIISKDDASGYMNQYRMSLTGRDTILGGIITRSSFDEILCTKDCNAIAYSLGRDSTATDGPNSDGVFIIFSGVKVDFDTETQTIESVNDLGINKYVPRNWCPPSCMPN